MQREGISPSFKYLEKLALQCGVKKWRETIESVIASIANWNEFADIARVPSKEAKLIGKILQEKCKAPITLP